MQFSFQESLRMFTYMDLETILFSYDCFNMKSSKDRFHHRYFANCPILIFSQAILSLRVPHTFK